MAVPGFELSGSHAPAVATAAPGSEAVSPMPVRSIPRVRPRDLLVVFGSMALWIAVMQNNVGWQQAIGFAVLILIHEMGHVVMNWKNGIKSSPPMFIPFLGALIAVKAFPDDPVVESECAAGGPGAGLLSALACMGLWWGTHQPYWLDLAGLGFALNLFNLLPTAPFDGARVATALAPRNWDFLLVALLLVTLKFPLAVWWLFLVFLFGFRLGRVPQGRHNLAAPAARARMTGVFLALLLSLGWGADYVLQQSERRQASQRAQQSSPSREGTAQRSPSGASAGDSADSGTEAERRVARIAAFILMGVAVLLGLGMAFLLPALIAAAAREPFGTRGGMAAAKLFLATLCMLAQVPLTPKTLGALPWHLLLAWAIALLTALVYSIHQWAFSRMGHVRSSRDHLTWRAMGWGAAGALALAYGLNAPWVAAMVLAGVAFFYVTRPALWLGLLAAVQEQRGALGRALELRQRALSRNSRASFEKELRQDLARTLLLLGQPRQALETLFPNAAERRVPAMITDEEIRWTALVAQALIAAGHAVEALAWCEALLRAPGGTATGTLRLALVRDLLGRSAEARNWPEEALAQANVLLSTLPANAPGELGDLLRRGRWRRALALAQAKRFREADAELRQARLWATDRFSKAGLESVEVQVALERGDLEQARQLAEAAALRVPEAVEPRFWRALTLFRSGQEEGRAQLEALAVSASGDHWGRRAAALLQAG